MATVYVAFCDVGVTGKNGSRNAADDGWRAVVSSALTITTSNTQSAAATRNHVRVRTDTACFVAIGANPDATTTTARLLDAGELGWNISRSEGQQGCCNHGRGD